MSSKAAKPTIWVLLDPRKGTANQALGLAERLGLPFRTIDVSFSAAAKLPAFLKGSSLIGIRNKKDFAGPFPDIVISAGRRLATAALWIKKQHPGTKLIHIMYPKGISLSSFSLVLVPSHDAGVPTRDNIHFMDGTIHRVSDKKLDDERGKWAPIFKKFKRPFTGVIVGGKAKNKDLSTSQAQGLIDYLNGLDGAALVTTSRRTSPVVVSLFKQKLLKRHFLYIPEETKGDNPFFGILALSDSMIVTGDSISMISEAGFSGKPLYIYAPKGSATEKHFRFHQTLYDGGYAAPLFSKKIPQKKLDAFPGILKALKRHGIL